MASPLRQEQEILVQEEDIMKLLSVFANSSIENKASDSERMREFAEIQQKSALLLAKDYEVRVIDNDNGSIGTICPEKIVPLLLRSEDTCEVSDQSEPHEQGSERPSQHMKSASWTSGRTRIALPVIFIANKYICRLGTLSGGLEANWQAIVDFFGVSKIYCAQVCRFMTAGIWEEDEQTLKPEVSEEEPSGGETEAAETDGGLRMEGAEAAPPGDSAADDNCYCNYCERYGQLQNQDILLLDELSVDIICDLAAQEKSAGVKPHKKVSRWIDFPREFIAKLPYPGNGFFKECKEGTTREDSFLTHWNKKFQTFDLQVCGYYIVKYLGIKWEEYYLWDVTQVTQNYLQYLLKIICERETGILVHCFSGWDRTPLFISLLRISLWADGFIHTSLSGVEMAYLTVAYDWLLFCYDLPKRVDKTEEIFFFCLHMLKHIHTNFSTPELIEYKNLDSPEGRDHLPIEFAPRIEVTGEDSEELQFHMSPSGRSSSSSFAPDASMYFPVEVNSSQKSPSQFSSSSASSSVSPRKSNESAGAAGSSRWLSATPEPVVGHPPRESFLGPRTPLPLSPTSGSSDESTVATGPKMTRDEFLQRRRDRLTEVRRILSSAYRPILEGDGNERKRASYWASSLYSET